MPKTAIDYSNTIIYKLVNYDCPENVYVGSSTNRIKRKQKHKQGATNPNDKAYNLKVYKMIRENGGWESWHMIDIKAFPCANRREAEAEEDKIMQELKANMNSIRAYLTEQERKQYYITNKEKITEYKKIYRENNKEKLSVKNIAYKNANKEVISDKNKVYREANKQTIKDKDKHYREANKESIKNTRAIKITCLCGATCCKGDKSRHERTKKHINYLNSLELNE